MIKLYNILFTYKNEKVCTTLQKGNNQDDAMLKAEFKLMFKYPNVKYDNLEILSENDIEEE